MALMGLVDAETAVSLQSPVADAPVTEDAIKLLQQASSHDDYPQFVRSRQCDGYLTREQFLERVPATGDAEQCNCIAHCAVFSAQYPSDVVADLKDLICTPPEIMSQDVGIRFIMALLQRLFQHFDMGTLEVAPAGHTSDVSYVLLHKQNRYNFRGHPDFVILEEYYGARQILISTGEIQSTSDPDTQTVYMLLDHF